MLTTVKGIYQDGLVRLSEALPATGPLEVVVVVDLAAPDSPATLQPTWSYSWDEALAASAGTSHVSVADEVIAEREERD